MRKKILSCIMITSLAFPNVVIGNINGSNIVKADEIINFEIESNNTENTANIITYNTKYTGNISTDDDVDYYKITIPQKGKGNLRITTTTKNEDRLFKAQLYKLGRETAPINSIYSASMLSIDGEVKELEAGDYYIKVSKGDFLDTSIEYQIEFVYQETPLVSQLVIICDKPNAYINDTINFKSVVIPERANNSVIWESSNKEVATIDSNGVVKCLKTGETIISAIAQDGSRIAGIYTLKVNNYSVESITINCDKKVVYSGDIIKLEAVIKPEQANKEVIWTSSDDTVATVSETGVVTCKKEGVVTITATAQDGSKVVGTYTVTVNRSQVKSLSISLSKDVIYVDDIVMATAKILPEDANQEVVWESSNKEVATINESGLITCLKAGETTITAVAKGNRNVTGLYKLKVSESVIDSEDGKLIEKISIYTNKNKFYVGNVIEFYTTIIPFDANNKDIIWETSDSNIAAVDEYGIVKCLKQGTAVIKAIAQDGSKVIGTYTLNIKNKQSNNNNLANIKISAGKLSSKFSSLTKKYVVQLDKKTSKVKITPVLSDANATYTINGKPAKSVTVKMGNKKSKTVKIVVTSETGKKKTYKVKVVRG